MNPRHESTNKFKSKYQHDRYDQYDDEQRKNKYDLNSTNCDKRVIDKDCEDFYFSKYKHELNKVFSGNLNIIQDIDDFWKFVNKYETVQKKLKTPDSLPNFSLNTIGVPKTYHKLHCINFKLSYNFNELFARVVPVKALTKERLLKFQNIIILYLDFKQKEKFAKLKKLRKSQENLPVYQYKHEIIETIKQEQVVIIAGDTGCGKSTQVPQYLYAAGFQKIGMYNYLI